jgi:hypothetical protein
VRDVEHDLVEERVDHVRHQAHGAELAQLVDEVFEPVVQST